MPSDRLISSAANSLVKRARRLKTRKGRDESGTFLVEGIRGVWSAVEGAARVEQLIVAPALLTSERARALVADQEREGVGLAHVTDEVFRALSERDNPVGVAAIVSMPLRDLDDLAVGNDSMILGLEDVHGPGNLGTIIRTADAVGAGVVLVGDVTDPFHPHAVKASMGALFHVPVARAASSDDLFEWATAHSITVAATSARRGSDHWAAAYRRPLLLLFGSEAHGLTDEVIDRATLRIRIPMHGRSSSLNLAAAVAVVAYEALGAHQGRPPFG